MHRLAPLLLALAACGAPAGECFEDSDCASRETCVLYLGVGFECVQRCEDDDDCAAPQRCVEYPAKTVGFEGTLRLCEG